MSVKIQIILVSLWFVIWLGFVAATIWGRMAEWNYKAAMLPAFRWLLMPPFHRLREKEVYIRFQKGMAWFGLFFVTLVYVLALASVLSRR